jgi:hypothetical protein
MKKTLRTILTAIWEVLKGLPSQIAKFLGSAIAVGIKVAIGSWILWIIWPSWNQINNRIDQLSQQATILDEKFEMQFHPVEAKNRDIWYVTYMRDIAINLLEMTKGKSPYDLKKAAR